MTDSDWSKRANRTVGNRAVGGKLTLTAARVLFEPHGVERAIASDTGLDLPRDQVREADMAPRTGNPFSGGLRKRLRLTLADGSEELFVVNRAEDAIDILNAPTG